MKLFLTTLSCGHQYTTDYKPPGVTVICIKCWNHAFVVSCYTKYGWHCSTCGKSASYIARKLYGEGRAMAHARAFTPPHEVTYRDCDGRVLWDSSKQSDQRDLDLGLS